MIEPGNMRERPHDLDREEIIRRVVDDIEAMCTETIELEADSLDLLDNNRLEYDAGVEILDRVVIAAEQIDIIRGIIKIAIGPKKRKEGEQW